MKTLLITAAVAIVALWSTSCMTTADGTRKVDPAAREFWAGVAMRAIIYSAK